jgi:transcriptional regulator with XRE-family HTH domain
VGYYLGMKQSRSVKLDTDKLKKWMTTHRWNQTTLARRIGIHSATMGRYMRGELLTPYTVIMALGALSGLTESDLIRAEAA